SMSRPTPCTVLQAMETKPATSAAAISASFFIAFSSVRNARSERTHVGEVARHRGGGGHRRADQMRTAPRALTALEVAVRGRRAALAPFEAVGVHGQAHRTARLPPLEAGGDEDLVQAFFFSLALDQPRARHHQHALDAR